MKESSFRREGEAQPGDRTQNWKQEGDRDNCDCRGETCSLRRKVNKERHQLQSSGRRKLKS